jgi:hypothetical protein
MNAQQVRSIVVNWIDEAAVIAAATKNGWTAGESLADFVNDINDYDKVKDGFSSVAKAKDWARRNRHLDVFGNPEVIVYEWPDERKLSWERERVQSMRYIGDGQGWEDVGIAA